MATEIAGKAGAEKAFDIDCHVINLARTPERMAAFLGQNSACGLHFQRFEAADGNALSDEDAIRLKLIKPGTKWRTKGTIGVALSHRNLWEKSIADDRLLVVFEDDVFIRDDFSEVFPAAAAKAGAWDIMLLGYNTDALIEFNVAGDFDLSTLFTAKHPTAAQLAKFAKSRAPSNLFPLRHAFGISAYAISPAGARKLIQRCFPMDNRLIVFKATNHRFNAFSLDCMMNVFYKDLAAFAFVGPLALPHNDWQASTVDARKR